MSSSNYFKVVSEYTLDAGTAAEVARDIVRSVNSRAIGSANAVVTLNDTTRATERSTTNEVTSLKIDATAGTFTITYAGQTTAALAFNITAADLQTAIAGLSTVGAGNVKVSGGVGNSGGTAPYYVQWVGTLCQTDISAPTADGASLTGGGAAATVTTVSAGGALAA